MQINALLSFACGHALESLDLIFRIRFSKDPTNKFPVIIDRQFTLWWIASIGKHFDSFLSDGLDGD